MYLPVHRVRHDTMYRTYIELDLQTSKVATLLFSCYLPVSTNHEDGGGVVRSFSGYDPIERPPVGY